MFVELAVFVVKFFVHEIFPQSTQDGIEVDKNGRIVYNIPYRANAIIRSPPPSPYPYAFFRDNFAPCFVVLHAIGDPP